MAGEDRHVKVGVDADVSKFVRGMGQAAASAKAFNAAIDKSNDRTVWLAQSITALGPALVPLGAPAITAVAGLTTQLTVAGLAAGATALAFNGIGDALGALNDYQLEPTEAHLAKLNETMAKVGPEGREFVEFLDSLGPALSEMSNATRAAMLPGFTDGLKALMADLPQFQRVIVEVSEGVGELARQSGAGLGGSGFDRFFNYLETDAKPILLDMGRTMGKFIQGTADLLVSFGPLTRDFSRGFADMAQSYADWAAGTGDSDSFQAFLAYLRESGPQAIEFIKQLSASLAALIKAAAPVGDVALTGLTHFLNVIEAIAETPLGPLLIGLSALAGMLGRLSALGSLVGGGAIGALFGGMNKGMAATVQTAKMVRPSMKEVGTAMMFAAHSQDTLKKSMASGSQAAASTAKNALLAKTQVNAFAKSAAPAAAGAGLLGLALTGTSDKMGLVNTTSLAMAGMLIGPWGAAVGGAAGVLLDLKSASDNTATSVRHLNAAIEAGNLDLLKTRIGEVEKEIAGLNDSDGVVERVSDGLRNIAGGNWASKAGFIPVVGSWISTLGGAESKAEVLGGALSKAQVAQKEMQAQTERVRAALARTYGAPVAAVATSSVESFNAAIARTNALLAREASWDAYQSALIATTESIKTNGRTLAENTKEGLANRAALRQQAQAITDYVATLFATGKAQDKLRGARVLEKARKDYIAARIAAGDVRKEAVRVANQLFDLNRIRSRPKIEVDVAKALGDTRAMREAIARLRDKNITITTTYVQRQIRSDTVRRGNATRGQTGAPSVSADGSFVPKTGLPYADRHPYLLADGEGITTNRNGETDRFRDVITGINAGLSRAQIKDMLADGGIAGQSHMASMRSASQIPAQVQVAAPAVRVFIDGREVRSIARVEAADVVADYADRQDKRVQVGRADY